MTILGRGDLSPPRRHGRRRTPVLAIVLLVAALAVGGWLGWRAWRGSDASSAQRVHVCVTPTAAPSPPDPSAVRVAVLNTTEKVGLAHKVADELKSRGFRIGHIGNVKAAVAGAAVVLYPPNAAAEAMTVAEHVPSAVVQSGSVTTVTLQIGPGFRNLAAPADVAAAHERDLAAASPRPAVCSSS
jgi:hypothetical protein